MYRAEASYSTRTSVDSDTRWPSSGSLWRSSVIGVARAQTESSSRPSSTGPWVTRTAVLAGGMPLAWRRRDESPTGCCHRRSGARDSFGEVTSVEDAATGEKVAGREVWGGGQGLVRVPSELFRDGSRQSTRSSVRLERQPTR